MTPQAPLVSVVMAVYNGERYLRESIDSILNQTYSNLELVVVDDGSTDSTWDILGAYQDPRLIILRNVTNSGQGEARNRAIRAARGEFVAIQDADDVSLPGRLANQVSLLRQHPTIGAVGSTFYRMDPGGHITHLERSPATDTEIRWQLLFGTNPCHATIMFRKDLADIAGVAYRVSPPVEDYDFLTQLAEHTQFACIQEPLYLYRIHGASTMHRLAQDVEKANADVSARQIQTLLPQADVTTATAMSLFRIYFRKRLRREDLPHVSTLFDLFDAFSQKPDVDVELMMNVKQNWMRDFIRALPVKYWGDFFASGLARTFLAHDRHVTAVSLARLAPDRIARRLAPRRGKSWTTCADRSG